MINHIWDDVYLPTRAYLASAHNKTRSFRKPLKSLPNSDEARLMLFVRWAFLNFHNKQKRPMVAMMMHMHHRCLRNSAKQTKPPVTQYDVDYKRGTVTSHVVSLYSRGTLKYTALLNNSKFIIKDMERDRYLSYNLVVPAHGYHGSYTVTDTIGTSEQGFIKITSEQNRDYDRVSWFTEFDFNTLDSNAVTQEKKKISDSVEIKTVHRWLVERVEYYTLKSVVATYEPLLANNIALPMLRIQGMV
tara:strand:- start:4853 stop:5587 length:735 start_codon:yes stop_codon:yes gene_type:complete